MVDILIRCSPGSRTALILALTAILGACNSPGVKFAGGTRHDLEVDGSSVTVYVAKKEAQAVITSPTLRLSHDRSREIALMAIERATGCTELEVEGQSDKSVLTASVEC